MRLDVCQPECAPVDRRATGSDDDAPVELTACMHRRHEAIDLGNPRSGLRE
jgi:hypothetical protein